MMEDNEFVYLYKLKEGSSVSSYAHIVASDAGIEDEVIDRGREVLTCITEGRPLTSRPGFYGFADFEAIAEDFVNMDLDSAEELKEMIEILNNVKL